MYPAIKCHAASTATEPNADLLARCEHALELLLTYRGNPSAELGRVLAEDPQCVFGHCLRAASIVRADATAERSTLAASVAIIEAACPDIDNPARRHAAAARAWLSAPREGFCPWSRLIGSMPSSHRDLCRELAHVCRNALPVAKHVLLTRSQESRRRRRIRFRLA